MSQDKLTKLARGRDCMIRGPTCNGNPDTVVLCHIRQIGISGIGLKAPSILGAWGCSDCHAYVDWQGDGRESRELLLLRGMARTINTLIREGVVK